MTGPLRNTRPATIAYAVAGVVIVLDQLTKALMLYGLHLRERGRIELSPIFDLSFVLNRGVSFGLLTGGETGRWLLSLFSVAVAVALAVWVSRPHPATRWVWRGRTVARGMFPTAVGLIIGGALGNVIDRVRFGGVVDFLDFSGLMFPWVFNVADSAISVGVAILLLDSFLAQREADAVGLPAGKG